MCSLWFQIWSDMRYTLRIFCFWSVLYSIWMCMKYLWDDYYYYIFPGGFTRLSWFIPYSYSMRRAFWHRRTWQFGIKYIHIFISLSSISNFFSLLLDKLSWRKTRSTHAAHDLIHLHAKRLCVCAWITIHVMSCITSRERQWPILNFKFSFIFDCTRLCWCRRLFRRAQFHQFAF